MTLLDLPVVNGSLNALSTIFLTAGYVCIKRKKQIAHRNCMIAAFTTSTLFLACYLTYHGYLAYLHRGPTAFVNPAWFRPIYFTILFTHLVLAIVIVPMVFMTMSRGLKQRFELHKKIARWTWPLWMYVSVTGVIIYLLLYQIYPQPVPAPKSTNVQGSNLPTRELMVLPRTSVSNSSGDIAFGKNVSSTAISAFSFTASSGRPPFSNCSMESRRFLTSF
jgi:putative membrane protein